MGKEDIMVPPQNTARHSPSVSSEELPAWLDILPLGTRMAWAESAPILLPETKSEGLHFVLSGQFHAVVYGRSGQQRTLWLMEKHSLIGEIGMLADAPAIYLMECRTAGETVFFQRRTLLENILPAHPAVALSLMRILAVKLRAQSEDSQSWNFMPAWKRVGAMLLHMEHESGSPLRITHHELAAFLGLHRVTVSRALLHLRDRGFIHYDNSGLSLHDREALARELHNDR